MIERLFRTYPYEMQFWSYETGNVVAAMAAIGGLSAVLPGGSLGADLLDLLVPLALAMLIALMAGGSWLLRTVGLARYIPALNKWVSVAGIALVVWAFWAGESWLSTAAIAFLTGSALIRLTDRDPAFLKLGALFLVMGGLALAGFGAVEGVEQAVNALTVLTGLYVAAAGVLAYAGGVAMARGGGSVSRGTARLARVLGRLDGLLIWCGKQIAEPMIFWLPAQMKSDKPFLTSMWARLPFRLATAGAAVLTATPEGYAFALANLLWAVGDVAIGSLDWTRYSPKSSAPEKLVVSFQET